LQRNAIGPRYGLPLLALSVALFAASVPFGPPEDHRFLVWGVPASLLLLSFVKLELAKVKWSRLSLLIGDASYSIYLVHVFFIIQFRGIFFKKAPQLAGLSGDLMILTLSIISVAFGVATYLIIEKPMTAALTGWYREFQKRTITGRVTNVVGS
jgi:exopolysaccharide production protein ExoZ